MITLESLCHHLDLLGASATTAAEALGDGAALDLPVLAKWLSNASRPCFRARTERRMFSAVCG
jgi:hypothetical protein